MKTQFFQVATSGPTIDGREISAEEIDQMAELYDPKVYGARISLDHLRSYNPESTFKMYGDVIELDARDVEMMGASRRGLFARLDVDDDLVELNKKNQKVFTSIEIRPNFAKTGKAYCEGIACTDEPASLGTDKLKLYSQNHEQTLLTEALETTILFEAESNDDQSTSIINSLTESIKNLTNKLSNSGNNGKDINKADLESFSAELTTFSESLTEFAAVAQGINAAKTDTDTQFADLQNKVESLESQLQTFQQQLDNEPAGAQNRPPADGGSGEFKTNF